MKRIYPQARFQLLGSVSYQNRTAIPLDTVEKWVDEGVVDYLGETSDVRPYIEAAHCVTLASYREGAPRTLIEASAMGRPVIATDVPGCRAVVDDGVTGFLCDAKSVDSLLDAMMRFMAMSHKEREQMGRSGSERMKQEYNVQFVVESYLQSIQKVVHPVQLAQFSEKASIS